jgi:N-methylhydantoinase B
MHRGGPGQELMFENLNAGPTTVSFLAERTRPEAAAGGLNGGAPGQTGEILIDGRPVDPKSQHAIEKGSCVLLRTPGGGGYGDPRDRPADLIARDLAGGYL